MKIFKNMIAAGTFDHLHQGHKYFLETAFVVSQQVWCGLTDYQSYSDFPEKQLPILIQNYSLRLGILQRYLKSKNWLQRAKIFHLGDRFGPTLDYNPLEAIVVSKETLAGANLVNQKRKLLGLKSLKIILTDTIRDSANHQLSASNIRLGQVNSKGLVYTKLFPKKTLYLPSNQRHHFKKPVGQLLKGSVYHLSWAALKVQLALQKSKPCTRCVVRGKAPFVITVGDITTHAFSLHKIPFNLAIIDQKTRREKHFYLNKSLLSMTGCNPVIGACNPPGTISPSLTTALQNIFSNLEKTSVLKVNGEEDLAVLPCILLAPLNTLIFYGQPFEGIVKIKVTEKIKEKAVNLFQKFIY